MFRAELAKLSLPEDLVPDPEDVSNEVTAELMSAADAVGKIIIGRAFDNGLF